VSVSTLAMTGMRDEVDTCTETLHDLNVERLETKTGSAET
jgi:hypothetical protein